MSKVSLKQLDAPCILYNLNGYYNGLKTLLDHMIETGLSTKERQEGIWFAENLEQIKQILKHKTPKSDHRPAAHGHAMDETWFQDILESAGKRMQGRYARLLWLPGTDHAGIATEAKVVDAMREEGLTKDVGRDGFPGARLGMEEQLRRPHRQPAEKAGLLLRLGA